MVRNHKIIKKIIFNLLIFDKMYICKYIIIMNIHNNIITNFIFFFITN